MNEVKIALKELDDHGRMAVRIEFKSHGDLEGAVQRVMTGETMILHLGTHWSDEAALKELAGQLIDETIIHEVPDMIKNYIDYLSFGQDLILGGDYSLVNYNGSYYAVSNH